MPESDKKFNILNELNSLSKRQKLLDQSLDFFLKNFGSNFLNKKPQEFNNRINIEIGLELEFYLLKQGISSRASDIQRSDFITQLNNEFQANDSKNTRQISESHGSSTKNPAVFYKTEQGNGQIEVVFSHTKELKKLCTSFEAEKIRIKNLAIKEELECCFAAQPFKDDCGSALQFNLSFCDSSNQNLFLKDNLLANKVAEKLLDFTNEMMIFLAPNEEDYQRFDRDLNQKLHKMGKFTAPTNLSFGHNNRTCAIRMADKKKRLEYRVAAASADIWLTLSCILIILSANREDIFCDILKSDFEKKYPEIHGNSFDEQYRLQPLISSFAAALTSFSGESNFFRKNLDEFLKNS